MATERVDIAFGSTRNGVFALNGGTLMPTKSKSSTIIKRDKNRMPPLHPGEMLREEFMIPHSSECECFGACFEGSGNAHFGDRE